MRPIDDGIEFLKNAKLVYDVNFSRLGLVERLGAMARLGLKATLDTYEAPMSLLIAVTGRCQCNCRHCGVTYLHSREQLEFERIVAILDEYRAMGGWRVVFSGGEPLLRDDLSAMVRHASGLGLATLVDTNAVMLDEARIEELKLAGLGVVEMSIDSMDPAVMDDNRGFPGALELVKKAIASCRERGLAFAVNTVAFRHNLDGGLDRIIEFCRSMGALYVRVLEPITCGRASDGDMALDEREREYVRARYEPGFVLLEQVGKVGVDCSAIHGRYLSIAPDGSVNPCPYMPVSLGNVKEKSLRRIVAESRALFADMRKCESECSDTTCIVNDPVFRSRFLSDGDHGRKADD